MDINAPKEELEAEVDQSKDASHVAMSELLSNVRDLMTCTEAEVLAAATAMDVLDDIEVAAVLPQMLPQFRPTALDGKLMAPIIFTYSNRWNVDYVLLGSSQISRGNEIFAALLTTEVVIRGAARRLESLRALAILESRPRVELNDFEVGYRRELIDVLCSDGTTDRIHVQELLLKRVGPEKYSRIVRRFADHQKELEVLKEINAELNTQIEKIGRASGPVIKGPMVVNQQLEPGTYLLEAGPGGTILASFKITAREDVDQKNMETILGAFQIKPEDLGVRTEATPIPEGAVPLNPSRKNFFSRLAAWLGFAALVFTIQGCGDNWIVPQPDAAPPASPVEEVADAGSLSASANPSMPTLHVVAVDAGCPLEEEPVDGGSGGSGGSDGGSGGSDGGDDGKVTLCHVPRGSPGNAHTIRVGAPAVAAHLRHGDYLGPCQE